MEEDNLVLPPGFRFHPTDEEIIMHYLYPKVLNHGFCSRAMGEVDLNKCEPWDLPSRAKMKGEKEWYFFCQKDRKYPTGMRTNRATELGYWKATGKDKEICKGKGVIIGMKKTLVFYKGRAPKGEKLNWVMHEYRLEGKLPLSNLSKSSKDEWVVSRVFDKNAGPKKSPMHTTSALVRVNSFTEELQNSQNLPPLIETPFINSNNTIEEVEAWLYSNKNTQYSINIDQNPNFFMFEDMENHSDQLMIQNHCKVEQFSNQSHDTGISTDRNTEISSSLTKNVTSYDEQFDFHSMWRF